MSTPAQPVVLAPSKKVKQDAYKALLAKFVGSKYRNIQPTNPNPGDDMNMLREAVKGIYLSLRGKLNACKRRAKKRPYVRRTAYRRPYRAPFRRTNYRRKNYRRRY